MFDCVHVTEKRSISADGGDVRVAFDIDDYSNRKLDSFISSGVYV